MQRGNLSTPPFLLPLSTLQRPSLPFLSHFSVASHIGVVADRRPRSRLLPVARLTRSATPPPHHPRGPWIPLLPRLQFVPRHRRRTVESVGGAALQTIDLPVLLVSPLGLISLPAQPSLSSSTTTTATAAASAATAAASTAAAAIAEYAVPVMVVVASPRRSDVIFGALAPASSGRLVASVRDPCPHRAAASGGGPASRTRRRRRRRRRGGRAPSISDGFWGCCPHPQVPEMYFDVGAGLHSVGVIGRGTA